MQTEQCQQGFDGLRGFHGFKPPPEGTTALNDQKTIAKTALPSATALFQRTGQDKSRGLQPKKTQWALDEGIKSCR